ncbi:MAG: family 16 glycoside hydrolase [Acidobacteriota bacterium]
MKRMARSSCLAAALAVLPLALSAPAHANTLSPTEMEEGWILLFDGASLYGWVQEGGGWKATSGAIVCEAGTTGYLRTSSVFGDFSLKCEFRMNGEGDSGVYLRAAGTGAPQETGYEIQINNADAGYPTGSLVGVARAAPYKALPGLWHQLEVNANGDSFVVMLDSIRLLSTHNAKSSAGYIGLASSTGAKVEFRSIKLKPRSLRPLFNGQDLSGWRAVDIPQSQARSQWSVRDGAIHVENGPGQLETTSTYENFLLQLSARTPPAQAGDHPDGGVFLRGDAGVYGSGYECQIRNEYMGQDRKSPVEYGTGGLFNLQRARMIVGEDSRLLFFTLTINARGRHIDVWVNGFPVTSYEDTRSEGRDPGSEARIAAGTISLRGDSFGGAIDFKNIGLVALPRPPGPAPKPLPARPPPEKAGGAAQPQVQPLPGQVPGQQAGIPFVMPGADPERQAKISRLTEQALRAPTLEEQVKLYEEILLLDPGNQVAYSARKDAQAEIKRRAEEKEKKDQEAASQRQQTANTATTLRDSLKKAESALLSGNLRGAHAAIQVARNIAPTNPEVSRLGSIIDARMRIRRYITFGGFGLGGLSLVGLVSLLVRRSRKKDPYVEIIKGVEKGKRYRIDKEVVCFGAVQEDGGDRNDVVIQDVERMISRFHCEIHRRGEKLYLFDCSSANGTFLDGKPVLPGKPYRIKKGSRIDLAGTCVMRLDLQRRPK